MHWPRVKYELTDEDVELADDIAHEARSLYEVIVQVLAKCGWHQDFATQEWRVEQRREGEFGEELRRPIAISHHALEYMGRGPVDRVCEQLSNIRAGREAAIVGHAWLLLPSIIKEGKSRSAWDMALEISRLLNTPRRNRP
jgi:hypothetical protein